ncbi:hypothetical protein HMPREF0658_1057 [Hoylesella marshii DSM 16973 = JCM 13450]|uniref:Uncharacterized protein n=1 Tax=Hoylesella marshii DSM 16973 = JCM 13450 TaxID=862515 RepID=E0NSA6_9BACT|nr:hypothetical protein HMPREF0658_1057 [Hoylesella marshii DSM 16973 = JCM 13450]
MVRIITMRTTLCVYIYKGVSFAPRTAGIRLVLFSRRARSAERPPYGFFFFFSSSGFTTS